MREFTDQLNDFIVRAKAATYVGSGRESSSSRPGSHDLEFREGPSSTWMVISVAQTSSAKKWFILKRSLFGQ